MARFLSTAIPEPDVRRLYCEQGLSTRAVAAALGCSETAVRNRLAQLGIARRQPWAHNAIATGTDELNRLYVDERLSLSQVAERTGCSLTTVWRRLTAAGVALRPDGGAPQYSRYDFSGSATEMAYLVGFRLGDLHVELEGDTVVVKCTSTREEQVALFRQLFEPYGRVYTDEATMERRRRKSVGMYARLNRSFDFLLPKQDGVPEWALEDEQVFFAFLAGYADAEGYVQISRPRGYTTPNVRFDIRCYDRQILEQLVAQMRRYGIACPPARRRVIGGYINRAGVRSNHDLWGLSVNRGAALLHLFSRLLPHARHNRRLEQIKAGRSVLEKKSRMPPLGTRHTDE